MASTQEFDEASTKNLLSAFQSAAGEVNTVGGRAESIRAEVLNTWKADSANAFNGGVSDWLQGLVRVKNALHSLEDVMAKFAHNTQTADDDAMSAQANAALDKADASSWASGVSPGMVSQPPTIVPSGPSVSAGAWAK